MSDEFVVVHTACGGAVTIPMELISRSELLKDVVESMVEPGGVVVVPAAEQVVRNWVACASMLKNHDGSSNTRELTKTLIIWLEAADYVADSDSVKRVSDLLGFRLAKLLDTRFGAACAKGSPCHPDHCYKVLQDLPNSVLGSVLQSIPVPLTTHLSHLPQEYHSAAFHAAFPALRQHGTLDLDCSQYSTKVCTDILQFFTSVSSSASKTLTLSSITLNKSTCGSAVSCVRPFVSAWRSAVEAGTSDPNSCAAPAGVALKDLELPPQVFQTIFTSLGSSSTLQTLELCDLRASNDDPEGVLGHLPLVLQGCSHLSSLSLCRIEGTTEQYVGVSGELLKLTQLTQLMLDMTSQEHDFSSSFLSLHFASILKHMHQLRAFALNCAFKSWGQIFKHISSLTALEDLRLKGIGCRKEPTAAVNPLIGALACLPGLKHIELGWDGLSSVPHCMDTLLGLADVLERAASCTSLTLSGPVILWGLSAESQFSCESAAWMAALQRAVALPQLRTCDVSGLFLYHRLLPCSIPSARVAKLLDSNPEFAKHLAKQKNKFLPEVRDVSTHLTHLALRHYCAPNSGTQLLPWLLRLHSLQSLHLMVVNPNEKASPLSVISKFVESAQLTYLKITTCDAFGSFGKLSEVLTAFSALQHLKSYHVCAEIIPPPVGRMGGLRPPIPQGSDQGAQGLVVTHLPCMNDITSLHLGQIAMCGKTAELLAAALHSARSLLDLQLYTTSSSRNVSSWRSHHTKIIRSLLHLNNLQNLELAFYPSAGAPCSTTIPPVGDLGPMSCISPTLPNECSTIFQELVCTLPELLSLRTLTLHCVDSSLCRLVSSLLYLPMLRAVDMHCPKPSPQERSCNVEEYYAILDLLGTNSSVRHFKVHGMCYKAPAAGPQDSSKDAVDGTKQKLRHMTWKRAIKSQRDSSEQRQILRRVVLRCVHPQIDPFRCTDLRHMLRHVSDDEPPMEHPEPL